MASTRIVRFKLNPDKNYLMIKVLEDGKLHIKGAGQCFNEIEIGQRCLIGTWFTTEVQEILPVENGIVIETKNSTYLIKEFSVNENIEDDQD